MAIYHLLREKRYTSLSLEFFVERFFATDRDGITKGMIEIEL